MVVYYRHWEQCLFFGVLLVVFNAVSTILCSFKEGWRRLKGKWQAIQGMTSFQLGGGDSPTEHLPPACSSLPLPLPLPLRTRICIWGRGPLQWSNRCFISYLWFRWGTRTAADTREATSIHQPTFSLKRVALACPIPILSTELQIKAKTEAKVVEIVFN